MKNIMDNWGEMGLILIIILGIFSCVFVGYILWWAIGVLFSIFGYDLSFWEELAVLIIILVVSSCGIRFKWGD